jgi:hypothetical protein
MPNPNRLTFQEEFDFLYRNIPTALYGKTSAPQGSQKNPADDFELIEEIKSQLAKISGYGNTILPSPGSEPDRHGFPWFSNIEELIEYLVQLILNSEPRYGTADLAVELGEDCFGMYLPMHAFFKSEKTPWGIYLFPSLIKDRAQWLYDKCHKDFPKIKFEDYVRVKVHGTFRHEVFHYQVERFATKLEILSRTPIYKPYNRNVEWQVRGTEQWLEEALAESAVHTSRYIGGRTKLPRKFITHVLRTCSDNKPAGYRDYHCKTFGGPSNAHLIFASQIANQEVKPIFSSTSIATIKQKFINSGLEVPIYVYHRNKHSRVNEPSEAII